MLRVGMLRALPIVLLLAACGASTGLPGGVTTSLFIRGVVRPPDRRADGQCVYPVDPSPAMLGGNAVFDFGLATTYAPRILVGVAAQSDEGGARVTITGFDVRVTDMSGGSVASFHSDGAWLINAPGGGEPAYAAVPATLIDVATATALRGSVDHSSNPVRLLASATVTGIDAAGNASRSLPVQLPIDCCVGCLVAFPPEVGPTKSGCANAPPPGEILPMSCEIGQGEPVDCRLCYATHAVCRP